METLSSSKTDQLPGWDGPGNSAGSKSPDKIGETAKQALPEKKESLAQVSLKTTGETSDKIPRQQQSTLVLEPPGFYAIAEDIERVSTGDPYLLTLDCIEVSHFWSTLGKNAKLYKVLENYYNALTAQEVSNRRDLLQAFLDLQKEESAAGRCFVLIIGKQDVIEELSDQYPPGQWRHVQVVRKGKPDKDLLEAALLSPEKAPVLVTQDLYADLAQAGEVKRGRKLDEAEIAYLEEIFSLNHIPDAPISNGGETGPGPASPLPIILDDGGFSFEGDDDFWKEADPDKTPQNLDEDLIRPYPRKDKAYCRTTKQELEIVRGDPDALEGQYTFYLCNNDRTSCFEIGLTGKEGKELEARPVVWPEALEPIKSDEEGVVTFQHAGKSNVVYSSPPRLKREPLKKISANVTFSPRKEKKKIDSSALDKENLAPQSFPRLLTPKKKALELDPETGFYRQFGKKLSKLF